MASFCEETEVSELIRDIFLFLLAGAPLRAAPFGLEVVGDKDWDWVLLLEELRSEEEDERGLLDDASFRRDTLRLGRRM